MSEWTWEWEGYDPAAERLRESLCTLGNGYFATRGAVPECRAGLVHCPGTYVAGCYNRLESTAAGREVVNEDLVNLPNWLLLRFRLRRAGGPWSPWFSPDTHALQDYRHTLDLRHATLTRAFRHHDDAVGVLGVEQTSLVHLGDPHLAALRTAFTAEDWSGEIEVESCLDGEVRALLGTEPLPLTDLAIACALSGLGHVVMRLQARLRPERPPPAVSPATGGSSQVAGGAPRKAS
ncbi:hypothetical protein ACIHCM_14735 [Streptomyces sp. NPDC052023]|uniref:hypothetical protein n=1 Tax=Streptomyces sp. NPDC052023 TaxID=3365681 RepID=UPI0037D64389